MTPNRKPGGPTWILLACTALATTFLVTGARANEARGDLNLELRLVETTPLNVAKGAEMLGVAKIDVALDAFRAAEQVTISVEGPDGGTLTFKAKPVQLGTPTWTDPGGEPLEPGPAGTTIPARGVITTHINVPLQGQEIHEIVVRITAIVGGQPMTTEAVVRAALGVDLNLPVEDGTYANFAVKGGN